MLLLTELNKVSELLCPFLLSISSPVVYSIPNYKTLLLGKSVEIFLQVHWITALFILTHLRKLVGGRSRIHFTENLFLSELLSFDLLLSHSLSYTLYLIEAIVL